MKKILYGILCLFLVALVPSVMATVPTASDNTVTTTEDVNYVFTTADFNFVDAGGDGDTLAFVKVTVLESVGDLKLSGIDVVANDQVAVADITAGNLKFIPVLNGYGAGYDSFDFTVIDSSAEESTSPNTMTIDIIAVNDLEWYDVDDIELDEDTPKSVDLSTSVNRNGIIGSLTFGVDKSELDTSKVDVLINPLTGVATFNPKADEFGDADEVIFTVDDGANDPVEVTVDVNIKGVNDADWNSISDITLDEDSQDQIDLEDYADKPSSISNSDLVYGIDDSDLDKSKVTVSLDGSIVTFTPIKDKYGGAGEIVFTIDDGASDPFESPNIDVDITRLLDDAPILQTLSNYIVQEDILISDIVLPAATDADGISDTTYYNLEIVDAPDESTFAKGYLYDDPATAVVEKIVTLWTGWNPITRTISGWTPDKEDIGELKLRLVAYDNQDSLTSPSRDSQEFTIDVYPKTMCEVGDIGYVVDAITIEKPDDGDDFGPGDTMNIEVNVVNGAGDDRDFMVEAILYDLDTQKKVIEIESDDENIDEDEDFTFRLEMKIPLDSDEDYKGDYVLYIKAYEDGEEEEQCLSDSIEIGIGRESHEIIIQSLTMNPLDVEAGDEVDVIVRVANIGRKDEEEVFVKLRNTELEIDIDSDVRDLGAYDESGNTYTFQFKGVKIPSDADTDEYDFEVFVIYEGGSTSTTWMDSPNYKAGSATVAVGGTSTSADDTTGDVVVDTVDGEGFPWSTVLWIIGDVVLIIVAIFFIKLIFSARKRRPKVKEVKL